MIYFVFVVVFEFFKIDNNHVQLKTSPDDFRQFLTGIAILVSSYECNSIVIQFSMYFKENRTKNFTKSMLLSSFLVFVFHFIPGTIGYLTFGTNVNSDLMKMYESDSPVVTFGTLSMVFKFVTVYVPYLFTARDTIQEFIFENSGITLINSLVFQTSTFKQ